MKNILVLLFLGTLSFSSRAQCPLYEFEKTIKLPANNSAPAINADVCFVNYDDYAVWFCFPRILVKEWQRMGFYALKAPGGILADTLNAGKGKEVYVQGIFSILQLKMESSTLFTSENSKIAITDLHPIGTDNYIYYGKGTTIEINYMPFTGDEYSPDGINKVHFMQCADLGQLSVFDNPHGMKKEDDRIFDILGNVVTDPQPFRPYFKGKKKFMIIL